MADPSGPLHDAAWWIGRVGSQFWWLWHDIKDIWLIGTWLAGPFYTVYERCYEVADKLDKADVRIESLSWDSFIDNFEKWAMQFLGASPWEFLTFGDNLFAFVFYKLGLGVADAKMAGSDFPAWLLGKVKSEWDYLDDIADDPIGWIKGKIVSKYPALGHFFDDPVRWVYYMLGSPWEDTLIWKYHLFGYLLYCSGETKLNAIYWDVYPKYWIRSKVLERWAFLDDILTDAVSWTWSKWKDSIDKYLKDHLDWLTRTSESVLKSIWERRLP